MKKFLVSAYRRLFNKCQKCGAEMDTQSRVDYVPAYGDDPPYGGTFNFRTQKCQNPKCGHKVERERSLSFVY